MYTKVYHQILDTAIGTKFVLFYLNIFMAGLEILSNAEFQALLKLFFSPP